MRIFVAGTFDNFHIGHQYLLWTAYNHCQDLVVIVARDKTVEKIKGKLPLNTEQKRLERLFSEFNGAVGIEILLGRDDANFMKTLETTNPTHLYVGYDQEINVDLILEKLPLLRIERQEPYFAEFFKSSKF